MPTNQANSTLIDKLNKLKLEKNATLLVHYYADGSIQDQADEIGDSFHLAKKGQESQADTIVMAGVVFMAESIKILNPHKKVLVPDLQASCSLVESSPFSEYLAWRKEHPNAIAVTYINSSAEVKTISDVIITSSNAEKIINSIPKDREILFGPDQHLGRWLSQKLSRPMIFWKGSCQVHVLFNANRLKQMIAEHPDARVIAHPECDDEILHFAQVIGSTSMLLEEVKNNPHKKFIVATETGILHQMQKARPDATLIQAPVVDAGCQCNDCPYMKMNSLEKIINTLEHSKNEILLHPEQIEKAKIPLQRMLDIAAGKTVQWPDQFIAPK